MIIVLFALLFLMLFGVMEQYKHNRRLERIPVRIHVNGTRGKSTTTRLIASVLREADYVVIAKTTGSSPILISEDGSETQIRRHSWPRIHEQMKAIHIAASRNANAVVLECMAIDPEMQWISEHKMIRSTIGVITNIREDHHDAMGSDISEMIDAITNTIPVNGHLVTSEARYVENLRNKSARNRSTFKHVKASDVKDHEMKLLGFETFRENVACTIAACEHLGIDRQTILRGLEKASQDPGVLSIYSHSIEDNLFYLINAMAANDLESLALVWEKSQTLLKRYGLIDLTTIGLFNNRSDRGQRIKEMARFASQINALSRIVVCGQSPRLARARMISSGVCKDRISIGRKITSLGTLEKHLSERCIVFAFGNIKGVGLEIMNQLREKGARLC